MIDFKYAAERVIRGVSCVEAGKAMGIHTDAKGRCKCPFHGGEHNNLKLYGEGRGYYCFVCHEHGTVIDLVMKYKGMKFLDAISWMNDMFGLGIDLDQKSYRNRCKKAEQYMKRKGVEQHGDPNTRWDARQASAKRNQKVSGNDQEAVG